MAKKKRSPKLPRQDKLMGPIKYKTPTGDEEPRMLEIASMRKKQLTRPKK